MVEIAIMIEGQDGLNWPRWQRLAAAVEDLGFAGLYRSDHYTNAEPPDLDSLELWTSLTWLASHTQRIEFGPLVSPATFRHPTMTARVAAAVDDLSGGRLTLGLGAGWQVREHRNYGLNLLDMDGRFARFEEYLEVVSRLLHSDEPVTYEGDFYSLYDAVLLPRPQRPGGPPVLIGGNGLNRTLPLVARYADEWNGVYITPEAFAARSARLDVLLEAEGRDPASVRRSLMVGLVFGRYKAEVEAKLSKRHLTLERAQELGMLVGMPEEIQEQIARFEAVGVQRLIVQWLRMDDLTGLEAFARVALPQSCHV